MEKKKQPKPKSIYIIFLFLSSDMSLLFLFQSSFSAMLYHLRATKKSDSRISILPESKQVHS